HHDEGIINLDKLTYAGNAERLNDYANDSRYVFAHGDINDPELVQNLFGIYQPRAIINFAAESHVDRSIENPDVFITTNINGTYNLLNCTLQHWNNLETPEKNTFRFIQISTDEVYGSLP